MNPETPRFLLLYYLTGVADVSVLLYAVLHRGWGRTPEGRHVMAYMASLALTLTVWSIAVVFQVPDWWQWVGLVAMGLLSVFLTQRLALIVQSWWRRRHPRT
jgi:hypothetical protein